MKIIKNKLYSLLLLEEGDYDLSPNKIKGERFDYVFIPETEIERYKSAPLYYQIQSSISVAGIFFGKILTYNLYENNL